MNRSTLQQFGPAAAFFLIPIVVVFGLFESQRIFISPPWTWFSVLSVLGALVFGVLAYINGASLRSTGFTWATSLLFLALAGYAAVSALGQNHFVLDQRVAGETVEIPVTFVLGPLASGVASMVMGWAFAYLPTTGSEQGRRITNITPSLWNLSLGVAWALVGVSAVGWVRKLLDDEPINRLASGVGGAAVVHVPLLLAVSLFLAAERAGKISRRLALAGAILASIEVALTGSRMGLALLVVLAVYAVATTGLPIKRKIVILATAGGALATLLTVYLALQPSLIRDDQLRHLFNIFDSSRTTNFQTAWNAFDDSIWTMLFGSGQGSIWIADVFEQRVTLMPEHGFMVDTPWGKALTSPHSVYGWALAELGIVGLALVVALVVLIWVQAIRSCRAGRATSVIGFALALSTVSFFFDQYLVRNFPIAILWWFALFAFLRAEQCQPSDSDGVDTVIQHPADRVVH